MNDQVSRDAAKDVPNSETVTGGSGSTFCSPYRLERWDEDYHPEFRETLYELKRLYYAEPDRKERRRMFAAAHHFIDISWMRDSDMITRDDMKTRYPRLLEDLEKLPNPWQPLDDSRQLAVRL